jgi:hypothetical protein
MSLTVNSLAILIYNLNSAIDSGKHVDISIKDVEEHIEKGDIIRFLIFHLGEDYDFGLFTQNEENMSELIERLQSVLIVGAGEEKNKWGVENYGVCLLIAWITEIIREFMVHY